MRKKVKLPKCFKGKTKTDSKCGGEYWANTGKAKKRCEYCRLWRGF